MREGCILDLSNKSKISLFGLVLLCTSTFISCSGGGGGSSGGGGAPPPPQAGHTSSSAQLCTTTSTPTCTQIVDAQVQAADAALAMAQSTTATLADAQAAKTLADGALATAQAAALNDPTQNSKVTHIGLIGTQIASRITQLQQVAPPPATAINPCAAFTSSQLTCADIVNAQA